MDWSFLDHLRGSVSVCSHIGMVSLSNAYLIFNFLLFLVMCMSVCGYEHVCPGAPRGQSCHILLELESQVTCQTPDVDAGN